MIHLHTVNREAEIRPFKVGKLYEVHEFGPHFLQPSQIRSRCESSYRVSNHLRWLGRSRDADHLQQSRSVESSVDDYVLAGVSYSVEQFPCCDPLRLSP